MKARGGVSPRWWNRHCIISVGLIRWRMIASPRRPAGRRGGYDRSYNYNSINQKNVQGRNAASFHSSFS